MGEGEVESTNGHDVVCVRGCECNECLAPAVRNGLMTLEWLSSAKGYCREVIGIGSDRCHDVTGHEAVPVCDVMSVRK
jgi:hypothetical protein